jgi:hypothetical protein
MLLVLALVPLERVLSGANVLSALAEVVSTLHLSEVSHMRAHDGLLGGRTVAPRVDRCRCCGSTLWWCSHRYVPSKVFTTILLFFQTGILGAGELLEQLAHDRVLPTLFLAKLPLTGARHVAVLAFGAFAGAVYASSGADLGIVSKMCASFSLASDRLRH